jgi:serine protease Do
MRKFVVIAASLACAGVGALAATSQDTAPKEPPAQKAEAEGPAKPETRTRKKTVIVERGDQGPRVFTWDENGDHVLPGLMLPGGPRIGVTVANLDEEQAKRGSGVTVTDVRDDGPAAKAGVKEKDVITEFDGEKVRSARQLTRLVTETPPGRTVKMAILRDGTRMDLQVTPEADEVPMAFGGGRAVPGRPFRMEPLEPRDRQFFFRGPGGDRFEFEHPGPGDEGSFDMFVPPGRGRLGVGIQDLSGQLAEYFGTKDGVLVSSVTQDSPAAKAGIRAGDVITSVDGAPVTSSDALIEAVQKAADDATLKIGYVRDKKPATTTATLETREKPKVNRESKPI